MFTGNVEQKITEASSIVQIVTYIAEEATPHERERLRPAAIGLLYIARDKLDLASKSLIFVPH